MNLRLSYITFTYVGITDKYTVIWLNQHDNYITYKVIVAKNGTEIHQSIDAGPANAKNSKKIIESLNVKIV